jgi:glycosyltransferase involved in cell wall biosynthesis
MHDAPPLFSVVIPCARPERLPKLLKALAGQTAPLASIEIIIATPHPAPVQTVPAELTLIQVETGCLYPPGKMRNIGAAKARGDVCFFLDDDCIPPPNWIETLQRTLETTPGVAVVGCRVVSSHTDFWSRCADYVLFTAAQQVYSSHRHLGCASLAVRATVFRQVEGFDTTLLASEDWDFGLRLEDAGWLSYFDASIAVLHDHNRNHFIGIMRQAYQSGRLSGLTVQRRHHLKLGLCGRFATRLTQSWSYPLFGLPYALAATLLHAWEMRGVDRRWLAFIPFLAVGRFLYQLGVWAKLRHDKRHEAEPVT